MMIDELIGKVVVPGELLCQVGSDLLNGPGTYEMNGSVFASLVGRVELKKAEKDTEEQQRDDHQQQQRQFVSVVSTNTTPRVIPYLKSIVTCKITKVNPRYAVCEILCVGNKSIPKRQGNFKGLIRKENSRSFEVDKLEMSDAFRPGDIVRAVVASLGTARSYELSTADTNLGVISADSAAGHPMIPISYHEMKCTVTGVVENRKVAKTDKTKFEQPRNP